MRRIKLVLAVGAVVVAMLAMAPGPVMAAGFDRCRDLNGDFVRCDGELFVEADEFDSFDDGFFFVGGDDFYDEFVFDDDEFFFGDDVDGDGISQSFEQEAESGDVDQSFDVG
jgi:hypothetical protein